jgi:phosphatidylethanolamine-binding protein
MSSSVQQVLDECKSTERSLLQLRYPSITITKPGTSVSKKDTQAAPTFAVASNQLKSQQKIIIIALDLDAPAPTISALLSPILHGITTDLVAQGSPDDEGWVPLVSNVKPVAAYGPPRPPPFSSAHRYVFLAWEQPEGLTIDKAREQLGLSEQLSLWTRVKWDAEACEKKLGLGNVLGGNYFQV